MNNLNNKILFCASFMTLIAAGMGFSIRIDIMAAWGQEFGFTQTELGAITGMGLFGFGLTIIFFSFFADTVGYGKLMVIAFLLHAAAVLTTLAAPYAFYQTAYGRAGAYWCLYVGQLLFSLGNGTCEAVINPLTASLYPKNKTHWLNILHAGWPGGLVLGALVGWGLNQVGGVGWMIRWVIVLAPILIYGLMMIGRPFPQSEAKEHGVSMQSMMGELGMLGAAVAIALLGLWMSNVAPTLGLPGWAGWAAAGVLWVVFGAVGGFSVGYVILAFLFVLHAMVGYVELGTDNWIVDITKMVLADKDKALLAFIWTNLLMTGLRFFAGPIVHKISPVGLLFGSAVVGTVGLLLLGMPAVNTTWLWMGAVTVYGLGKTFYWPTMLGVVSERFPKGGALALGFSGGVGMLSAGILGGPMIGYKQDYAATQKLKEESLATYDRYKADEPIAAPVPGLPAVAGLDNSKVGDLLGVPGENNGNGKLLEADLEALKKSGRTLDEDVNLKKRVEWWNAAKPYAGEDEKKVAEARLYGGKMALTWTAAVPAAMAVGYLLLLLYFMARGGYKQVHISAGGEEVEDAAAVAARAHDREYGIQRPGGVRKHPE
jgi:MFS family permease